MEREDLEMYEMLQLESINVLKNDIKEMYNNLNDLNEIQKEWYRQYKMDMLINLEQIRLDLIKEYTKELNQMIIDNLMN